MCLLNYVSHDGVSWTNYGPWYFFLYSCQSYEELASPTYSLRQTHQRQDCYCSLTEKSSFHVWFSCHNFEEPSQSIFEESHLFNFWRRKMDIFLNLRLFRWKCSLRKEFQGENFLLSLRKTQPYTYQRVLKLKFLALIVGNRTIQRRHAVWRWHVPFAKGKDTQSNIAPKRRTMPI